MAIDSHRIVSVDRNPTPSIPSRWEAKIVHWLTPERRRVYPLSILIITLVGWLVSLWIGPGLTDSSGTIIGADFVAFYTGGRFFWEDRLVDLYNFGAQQAVLAELVAPVVTDKVNPFINPPFSVLLYAPFARGDYLSGLLLWWGVGMLLLVGAVRWLRSVLFPQPAPSMLHLFWLSLLFYPTLLWFTFGQNTALTLLIYTATFLLLRRGNDLAAGLVLGCLLYKPQLAIALALVLLIKGRWRALVGGGLGAGAWLLAGFLVSPAAMWRYADLMPHLPELLRSAGYKTWGLHSFYGFAVLLLDGISPPAADGLALALTGGGLAAVIWLWRKCPWQPGTRPWDFALAATLALGLCISPHLYIYDLMLLLLPLGIVWSYYPGSTDRAPLDGGALLVWTAFLYASAFFSSYLAMAQLWFTATLGLPAVAVQVSVFALVGWSWTLMRMASAREDALGL